MEKNINPFSIELSGRYQIKLVWC